MEMNQLKDIRLQQYLMNKKLQKQYSPFADTDGDGFVNMMDCYPFDKKRHGIIGGFVRRADKPFSIKTTAIAPTTTAVRSVDIVGRQGTSAEGTGGAITVKGKTAWAGGGGSPSGQAPTQVQVTGVNVDPDKILAFGESRGIVDTTTPSAVPVPSTATVTTPVRSKTWLSGVIRVGSPLGFAPEVVSAYGGVKGLAKISGEKERQRNLLLIKKYNEGKSLTKWEQNKLRQVGYNIAKRYPEESKGGWSITQKYFELATERRDPKTGDITRIQFYEKGERERLLAEGKPAPTNKLANTIIQFTDYMIKLGYFGVYLKTGAYGQKQVTKTRTKTDRQKLSEYIKSVKNEMEKKAVYDKEGARKIYTDAVKRFGKGSNEVKFIEKTYRNVLSRKDATALFKDALQQEGLISERTMFPTGISKSGTDLSAFGETNWAIPNVDVPVMKNVEAVAGGSALVERVFDLFRTDTKTDVKRDSRLNLGLLSGGMTITKTRLTLKQQPTTTTTPRIIPRITTTTTTTTTTTPRTPTTTTTTGVPTFPTYWKPPKPPKIPKVPLLLLGFGGGSGRRTRYRKQSDYFKVLRKAYQPSVGAVVLGIKAKKKPKFKLTGLELRPVISKRKGIKRKKVNYLQNVNKILG